MDTLSWEEKYLRLRSEKDLLAKKSTAQDRSILQMRTKFAKLESLFKQKQRIDGNTSTGVDLGDGDGVIGRRTDKDNEQLVTDLYKRNAKLVRENKSLLESSKTASLTVNKLKRELQLARRRTTTASKRGTDSNHDDLTDCNLPIPPNSKLAELVEKLRHRLINAEKQLGALRDENSKLRSGAPGHSTSTTGTASIYAAARSAAFVSSTSEGEEILRLQRELRDTAAKLQLLQTRYDHMDSKTKAQNELQQGSFEQLEEYNRKIRDLRLKLQEAQHDKDVSDSRASRAEELEEEVRMLQEQNLFLEDKVTRLCEAPFMSSNSAARTISTDFDRQKSQHKQQLEKLQEVASTHHAALQAIQKEADHLRREKEQLQKQIDRNGAAATEGEYARQISRDKSNLFGSMSDLQDLGMEDVDITELERALAIVRRKMDDPTDLDFLQRVDDEDLTTLPALKKRLQMVQVTNLSITRELERAERMLKAQASINRDLHLELEEGHKRSRTEKDALQAKLEDFESLCLKRLQRIHSLEAQVRQHLYSLGSGSSGSKGRKTPAALNDLIPLLDAEDNLLQEIAAGDFGPDENLIEVYIVDAEISENTIASTASTFMLVDFFDYESQATPLTTGLYPRYDFATTYKVTVDDFFLRFLATDKLTIEMNKAQNADYQLLAKASVTLSALLESSPKILLSRLPLISTRDGSIAGYLHMEVRMALPITELYRLFLDRHPEERSRIEAIARQNLKTDMVLTPDGTAQEIKSATATALGPREEARLSNELTVLVKSASNLSKSSKHSPSTYVHYQLLGFQDIFSNVVDTNSDPNYNHKFSFPIITDPKLLRFLKNYKLQFAIFEDSNSDSDDNVLLGECKVPLSALTIGEDISIVATLYNTNKHEVGSLSIDIKWNSPLKRPADAGPNALTAPEIEELMSRFGPQKDGQVNYVDFVRFADPSPAVIAALDNFSRFLEGARKEQGITTAEFFEALCESKGAVDSTSKAHVIDSEGFVSGLMTMQFGVPPDEIAAVYSHIDIKGENKISLKEFLRFAEPPVSSATAIITEKLRLRCQQMHRMGTPVMVPFQRSDASNSGRITRLQFKDCLREMGFVLVDDDFMTSEDVAHSTIKHKKPFGDDVEEDGDEIIGVEVDKHGSISATNDMFEKSRATSSSTQNTAANEMKRQEFDKRVKELTQQNNAAAASIDFDLDGAAGSDDEPSLPPQRLSQTLPAQNKRPPMKQQVPYDTPLRPDMAATTTGITHFESTPAAAAETPATHSHTSNLDTINIVDVETMLNDCCKIFKGTKILPENLKKSLQTADDVNEGYLSKRKFASTITSNEHMHTLSPVALESAMSFFQKTKSGSQIDYRAFLTFMGAKQPAVSNGVSLMSKMVLHAGTATDEFTKFDAEGSGYVKRADFYDCIRGLGFSYLSSADMDDVAGLFEFGNRKGEIYYAAFVEYVCNQEAALELKDVESKVRSFVRSNSSGWKDGVNEFRDVFAKFDTESKGVVTAVEFGKGLDALGLALPRSDMDKLFMRADPRGTGVSYKQFVDFILDGDEATSEPEKRASDFDMGLLQLKCFAVAKEFSGRHADLKGLSDPFQHYDWRRTGKLPLRCFAAAVRSAGFTFTRAEIVVLAQHFGDSGIVPYNDFLNWSAPDGQNIVPVIGGNVSLETLMAKLRSLAARSENGSYSKWNNVFEAADVDGSGIIEEDTCRSSFRTLGVKISEAEARALSQEFGGGKKTAVRYRALLRVLFPGSGVEGDGKGINALRRLQSSANRCDMDLSEIARKAREIFATLDLDGIGYCTTRSFKKGLVKLVNKVKLAAPSDNDVEELLERFDMNGDGNVAWKEFVSESFAGGGVGAGEEMESISRFKVMVKRCVRKGMDYRAAFERLDEGFKGSLSMIDFKSALQELGGGLTEGEVNALAGKFRVPGSVAGRGEGGERSVLYIELLHSLVPAREVEWEEVDGWRIEEKLRSMIKNRFEFWVPGKLSKAFKFFDRPSAKGKIGVDQLADGLKRLKAFRLSSSQEQRLFEIMDLSGKGYVSYNDFVVFVRDGNFLDVCVKVVDELKKNSVGVNEVKKALEKKSDGNALIGIKEFMEVMEGVGVTLSKSECSRLSNYMFVDEENNNVGVKQFVEFVKRGGKREGGGARGGFLSDSGSDSDSDSGSDGEETGSKKVGKLMKKLKDRLKKAEDKGIGGKSSFEFFDKDGNGEIDEKELVEGCKKLMKVALSKKESRSLMDKFKGKRVGKVKYGEFLKALGLEEEGAGGSDSDSGSEEEEEKKRKKRKGGRSKSRDRDMGDIISMIRKEINRLGKGSKGKPNVKKVFKEADRDGNGVLSVKEFKKCLVKMGFDWTSSELKKVVGKLDENEDGEISWKEFERFTKADYEAEDSGDSSGGSEEEEEEEEMSKGDMKKKIVKSAKMAKKDGSSLNYKRIFGRLDVLDDGVVSKKEFKKAVEDLGMEFEADDMKGIMKKLDGGKGKVKYGAFVKMAKGSDSESEENADVDDLALFVRKELKRVTQNTGKDSPKVMKFFEDADTSGDGELSSREFKKILKKLGFNFKTDEEDRLLAYLDTDSDGHISYKEFSNLLGLDKKKKKRKGGGSDSESESEEEEEEDDAYVQLVEKLCSAIEKGRDVLEAFEAFDRSGNGEISEDDFKEGLVKLRVKGNGKAIKAAFGKFKGRRTGKIVFNDFVKAVEKKSSGGGKKKGGDDDAISKKLKKELKRLTKSNSGPPKMRAVFEELDLNGNGRVDESELKKGLRQMGFKLDRREVKEVFDKFDENGRGDIEFEEFVSFMGRDEEDSGSEEEMDEVMEALRKDFKRITKSRSGPPKVRTVFEEMDTNGDGVVSKREFRNALDEMGFRFSESTLKKLVKKLDSNGDGLCDYEEFEKLCEGGKKKGGKKVDLGDVEGAVVRKMKKSDVVKEGDLMGELEKFEKDLSGRKSKGEMRVKDFEKALKESFDGLRLSRGDLKDIVSACDPDETGKVKYKGFVNALE